MTLADYRAVFIGACYVLGAAIALSVAIAVFEAQVLGMVRRWRDPRSQLFDPCGLLDYQNRPCFLPSDHLEREHATNWFGMPDHFDTEQRHRFDDTATEGRFERRVIAGKGYLPKVSRSGDALAT